MKKLSLFAALLLSTFGSRAATVNWAAGIDTGFADSTGAALAQNNLLRIGYFNTLNDTAVMALRIPTVANVSALNADFVEFGEARIGDVFGVAAAFQKASTFLYSANPTFDKTGTVLAQHQQMYVWAFKATNNTSLATVLTSVTEQAIIYKPFASSANWKWPASDTLSTNIDISEAKLPSGGVYLAGIYQPSNASVAAAFVSAGGAPGTYSAVQLQAVPEPSTLTFWGLAVVAAGGARRRKRN